jgi:ribosomal protein S18 acetylase RimI-like enzyme
VDVTYRRTDSIDGAVIYRLFDRVGWIAPRSAKPARHRKVDGISNHAIYLDSPAESGFLEETFANSTAIYVAKIGEEIVGCVRVLSDLRQRSVVYDLVVDPGHQKKGIGTELLKMCLREFSKTQITLGTSTSTMGFYERLGFVPSGNYLELSTEAY